jgi:hypothetical protein
MLVNQHTLSAYPQALQNVLIRRNCISALLIFDGQICSTLNQRMHGILKLPVAGAKCALVTTGKQVGTLW